MIRTRDWLLGACLAALSTHAFGQSIVVPNGNATVVGNAVGSLPTTPVSGEFQVAVDGGQFPSEPVYITGFSFRAAPGTGSFNLTFSGNVYLSTSLTYPSTSSGRTLLSTTFANNVGPDNTLVFSGSGSMSGTGCSVVGTTPCPWANTVGLTTPFLYNPANGTLLIDLKFTSIGASSSQPDKMDCSRLLYCDTFRIPARNSNRNELHLRGECHTNHVHSGERRALRDLQLHGDAFHLV
jgi:hypothetical protein